MLTIDVFGPNLLIAHQLAVSLRDSQKMLWSRYLMVSKTTYLYYASFFVLPFAAVTIPLRGFLIIS